MKKNPFSISLASFLLNACLKNITLYLLILIAPFSLAAQIKTEPNSTSGKNISGKIIAPSGDGLAGVTVGIKNSNKKTSTDENGRFSITANDTDILEISYVGYKSQELPVAGKTSFLVSLSGGDNTLNDVVVVGYTSQKKSSLTGAITSVNMGDIEKRRVSDVAQLLQGQVAGVQVSQSTGAPGDAISVTIRGVGTFAGSSPLYIIDGTPATDISFLAPGDIQTMTVLKDAAGASIYGARASGGVVVITTKAGVKGKSAIDINYFNGIQKVRNLPTMLNGTQYMNKMEESFTNAGYGGTNPYTADKLKPGLANTDWLKQLFVKGHSQNLQVAASGGTDKIQYLISGGYYRQNGIVIYNNDMYQRINFRTNINANITDRFTIGINLQLSDATQDKMSSSGDAPGIIRHAFIRPPVIAIFKDAADPTYTVADPFTDLPFYAQNIAANGGVWNAGANRYEFSSNPIALAYFTNDKRSNFKIFGNVYTGYDFLKNKELKFKSSLGADVNFTHNKAFNQNFGDDDAFHGSIPVDNGLGRQNRPNSLVEDRGQETTITWTNTLNYSKKFQQHAISVLVGSEYITNYSSSIGATRNRFDRTNSAFQYIDFGGYQVVDANGLAINTPWNGGSAAQWALFSLFGSVNYNYDNRFFATASVREDASSQFGINNQQAFFPSFSAGWRLTQEKFMRNIAWLSDLKFRASTGKLGNQSGLSQYNSLAIYNPQGVLVRYGNPDLKWETTNQNNIGVDIGLLKNKIFISADYFQKTTSGILLPLNLPALVGDVQPTNVNAGAVINKGFELAVGYKNNDHRVRYTVNANIATVTNTVSKLHPNLPSIYGPVSKTAPGQPLNEFYGFKMAGIYQSQKEIDDYLPGAPHTDVHPGDIKFKDLDGNGIINDMDRTYLGNPNPRFTYGFNLSATFMGFDVAVFLQGVNGVERFNDLKRIIDYDTRPFNHSTATLNAWHGAGTSNSVPRSTFTDNGSSRVSDIYIEDASYMRLKNVEIGYTLPALFGKSNQVFKNIRLYASAQNLFTITHYSGLDPESVNMFDQGTYPQSSAFLFGINLKL